MPQLVADQAHRQLLLHLFIIPLFRPFGCSFFVRDCPKEETKAHIFEDAVEEERNTLEEKKEVENKGVVPDGSYYIRMEKISDGYKNIKATAIVENGKWKIKAGSIMGIVEDKGVTKKAKDIRQKSKNRQKREITRRC